MTTSAWFQDLPVLGALSPEQAAAKLREVDENGLADVLVGLEPLEVARALVKVSKRTTVIANTRPVLPVSLQSAGTPYPPLASLLGPVGEAAGTLTAVDASALASRAGSPRSLNVVMLGMLEGTGVLPFPGESLLEALLAVAGPGLERIHREAFRLGRVATRDAAGTPR